MPDPPDPGFVLASALQLLAGILAGLVTWRRRREFLPIAVFFAIVVPANFAHHALRVGVLVPAHAALGAAPLVGAARLAWQATVALRFLHPAALAGLALVVMLGRRPWVVAAPWLVLSLVIALGHPATGGAVYAAALRGADVAAALTVVVAVVASRLPAKPKRPEVEALALFILFALQLGILVVHRFDIFTTWIGAQTIGAVVYASIVVIEGGVLWIGWNSESSS